MDGYLYETHLHTSEGSACGKVSGSDYIDYMKGRGFRGMIVTDHFFNGNSAVPKDLPWRERILIYTSGYKKALLAAEGQDFDVLFGVEYNFDRDEYLIYGVDEAWLLENEDLLSLSRTEVYRRVHEAGAVMVQAHPYRERNYISHITLMPEICDGIEIYNAANPAYQNVLAYRYAKELKVPMTAGSDIHFFYDGAMGGMLLPQRICDASEYADLIREGAGIPVAVSGAGPDLRIVKVTDLPQQTTAAAEPTLPVHYVRD